MTSENDQGQGNMKSIVFITIASLFLSCTHHKHKEQSNGLKAELDSASLASREEVTKNLDKLVEAAKIQGPSTVEFLASDFYLKASSSQSYGDYQTASLLYGYILKLKPEENFVKNKYAISLIRTGDLESAQKILQELFVSSSKKDERTGLILAGVHTALSKSAEARQVYNEILKAHPTSQDACVFLSKSFSLEKKFKESLAVLDSCQTKSKEKGVFSYYKGKVYLDKGDIDGAMKLFKLAQKQEPDFSQATLAVGLIQEEKGQVAKAVESYKKYLEDNADDKVILSRLVQVLFSAEKFVDVIPYAEKLSEIESDNLNLKVKLGILYTDAKNFVKAKAVFKDVLSYSPTSDRILYYLGALHQETNEYNEAISYFNKVEKESALYQDSTVQVAHMMSVIAADSKNNDSDKTKNFLRFTRERMKEIPQAKVDLSLILANHFEAALNNKEAINILEGVAEEKDFGESHRYYLASLYEKEKRYDDSTSMIQAILATKPDNAQALNFMGYVLLERGSKPEEALVYIEKALKLNPKDGYIRDSLAWYYYKIGKYEQALKEIKEAKKIVNDDPVIIKHLGMIYQALNRLAEAKESYIEALKNCKYEHERKEIYDNLNGMDTNRFPANQTANQSP